MDGKIELANKHYTLEEKQNLCEQWKVSGKSKVQFCKDKELSLATFYGWCAKLLSLPKKEKILLPIKIINERQVAKKDETETTIKINITNQMEICFSLPVKNVVGLIQELTNAIAIIR